MKQQNSASLYLVQEVILQWKNTRISLLFFQLNKPTSVYSGLLIYP